MIEAKDMNNIQRQSISKNMNNRKSLKIDWTIFVK